ncbi:GGDEF domain-containing protein [Marinobacterium sp. D7]|uniref:GGDEF domain-containing protein n=1 Tax=Marinobacterium ramblicola TaxID=2849041 RepID=UPI001C2D651A|nr:GGDEF domain-containing protein [Marinobacterium ramblicola]
MANRKLKRLSNVDELTRLFNRRYFDEVLIREIKRLKGSSFYFSLILCDIDQFKQYKGAYGHWVGDDCIRSIASVMQRCCRRASDIVARYGGEEFCVVSP